jgi:uncharacterized membrane protein
MTLITAMAFLLAVRLNAMVVAVLGIAGGFLTPVLLSTGEDYPLGLSVYIALLDVGLLAVAQRQRWNALAILGGLGTALMQFAWITTFFVPEKYFGGNKVLVVMAVFAGFQGLFLAAEAWAKRTRKMNHELLVCALGLAGAAIPRGVLPALIPNDRTPANALVQLCVHCRSWPSRAHVVRKQIDYC